MQREHRLTEELPFFRQSKISTTKTGFVWKENEGGSANKTDADIDSP